MQFQLRRELFTSLLLLLCEVIKIKWQNEQKAASDESTENFQQSARNERVQRWKKRENYVPK